MTINNVIFDMMDYSAIIFCCDDGSEKFLTTNDCNLYVVQLSDVIAPQR